MATDITRHVLCPIDYSDGSRTALRSAAVTASFLEAQLTVLTVNDPLLVEAAEAAGQGRWPAEQAYRELRHFCAEALGSIDGLRFDVRVGRPAAEIIASAGEIGAAAIVMGAQGTTGLRNMFFGLTAERVLRDSTVPVLITPVDHHSPGALADLRPLIRRIVVPVDLSSGSAPQPRIASAIGVAIDVPLLLFHAVEPLSMPLRWRSRLPSIDMERRSRAEAELSLLRDMVDARVTETLVAFGEPAEEIAKLATARSAGLIVMGLHASGAGRVGSVTYRVLSLARIPVLALPSLAASQLDLALSQVAHA